MKRKLEEVDLPAKKQKNRSARGCFIVFEGLDRTGKTTQSTQLREYLASEKVKVHHMRFPQRQTPVGKSINSYLQSSLELDDMAIHLLFAANRWEVRKTIEDRLNNGETIVADRFSYSGVAYSAAKEREGMDIDWCWSPEINLPEPDLIFFLDIDPKEAAKRGEYGEERYEKLDFQIKVRKKFHEIIKRDSANWQKIDATASIEEIQNSVREEAMKAIKATEEMPLNRIKKLGESAESG